VLSSRLRRTKVAQIVVAIAAVIGVVVLGRAAGVGVAAGAGALAVLAAWSALGVWVLRVLGSAVVATLSLLAFNVVTDPLGDPSILLGLGFALIVYGWAAFWYLRIAEVSRKVSVGIAVAQAVGFVVVLPFAFAESEDRDVVPKRGAVASKLDLLIVTPATRLQAVAPPPDVAGLGVARDFDVRYSIGSADGTSVRWTLVDSADEDRALKAARAGGPPIAASPRLRPDADALVLLVVDGTPAVVSDPAALPNRGAQDREVGRWRRVARATAPVGTPVYALLQSTRRARIDRWRRFSDPGGALSAQALASPMVTDAAFRLAIGAPTSHADFALAMKHRPLLLFDAAEPAPLPLSIEALFAADRISQCEDRRAAGSTCTVIRDPRELVNGGTHLELRLPSRKQLHRQARLAQDAGEEDERDLSAPGAPPAATPLLQRSTPQPDAGLATAIYVHPVGVETGNRRLLYLDYWWYLPYNPTGSGGGAFCGAGLVIPGVSCFDHESDWEGVTVVIDRTGIEPRPIAVHYASHSDVVRYDWASLRARWDREPRFRRFLADVADGADRPLVFVAAGTHASYPVSCSGGCVQTPHPTREERAHRGTLRWEGNDTTRCARTRCVRVLPTRAGGTLPALWNGFDGVWGRRHCVLRVYCNSTAPPAAPGRQGRYRHPTRYNGYVEKGRFKKAEFAE
jgi:hypothetical protein